MLYKTINRVKKMNIEWLKIDAEQIKEEAKKAGLEKTDQVRELLKR